MNKFQTDNIKAALKAHPHLRKLVDRLRSLGDGIPVIWQEGSLHTAESFVVTLLVCGRVSNGKKNVRLRQMQFSQCHENSEYLSVKYPQRYQRETGYALYKVGKNDVWAPHSWVFDRRENQIVETTALRKLYFGVVLKITEAERKQHTRKG